MVQKGLYLIIDCYAFSSLFLLIRFSPSLFLPGNLILEKNQVFLSCGVSHSPHGVGKLKNSLQILPLFLPLLPEHPFESKSSLSKPRPASSWSVGASAQLRPLPSHASPGQQAHLVCWMNQMTERIVLSFLYISAMYTLDSACCLAFCTTFFFPHMWLLSKDGIGLMLV